MSTPGGKTVRVLPYGETAVLAEIDDERAVLDLAELAAALPGVAEVVPGARTVLVLLHDPAAVAATASRLTLLHPQPARPAGGTEPVSLDVHYDGPDLTDTAAELGLEADGLVRAHSEADYVVAFCGFVPGFAYLRGLPEALHVARRAEPRTRVPAGSVGIAGPYSGVYPSASPGGWRLLGRTSATLWDLTRTPPALLAPGTPVRFRPVAR